MFGAVGSFAIVGGLLDPNSWVYDLELPTPSGQMMRRELGAGLIHVRLNVPTGAPWRGTSPLADAGLSAAALAAIEQRLADESKARVGYLLTYPDGVSDATINGVRGDLQSMAGGVMPVESAGGGFRSGMTDARGQWSVTRFGAQIPESSLAAANDSAARVCAALGVSPKYWTGQGVDQREAGRQLHFSLLQPLAALVSTELSAKLNRPVSLTLEGDGMVDMQQRTRATANLVQAGFTKETAAAMVGLAIPAAPPGKTPELCPLCR